MSFNEGICFEAVGGDHHIEFMKFHDHLPANLRRFAAHYPIKLCSLCMYNLFQDYKKIHSSEQAAFRTMMLFENKVPV